MMMAPTKRECVLYMRSTFIDMMYKSKCRMPAFNPPRSDCTYTALAGPPIGSSDPSIGRRKQTEVTPTITRTA